MSYSIQSLFQVRLSHESATHPMPLRFLKLRTYLIDVPFRGVDSVDVALLLDGHSAEAIIGERRPAMNCLARRVQPIRGIHLGSGVIGRDVQPVCYSQKPGTHAMSNRRLYTRT